MFFVLVFRKICCVVVLVGLWSVSLQATLQTILFPLQDSASLQKIPGDTLPSEIHQEVVRPILDFIEKAKTSLEGGVYKLDYPPLVEALLKAKERGVSLTLFVESSPFQHPGSDQATTNIALLKNAGIQVIERFPGHLTAQLHAKFFIADQKRLLLTTMNWDRESFVGATAWRETPPQGDAPTRDVAFIIDDPAVVAEAVQWWAWIQGGADPKFPAKTRLTFGPLRSTRPYLVDSLKMATKSLRIWQQSVQDDAMVDILIDLQKRGVQVFLVMSADPFHAALNGRFDENLPNLRRLVDAGVQVSRLAPFTTPYIHMKGVIIDDVRFLFTTANFYGSSLDEGFEVSALLDDSQMIKELEETFQKDFAVGMRGETVEVRPINHKKKIRLRQES